MTYEYEKVATTASGLRLFLNENTAGCSPAVIDAIGTVTRHQVAFYPDYELATSACAARLGVTTDRLVLTNGLDEGILVASMSALRGSPASAPFETIIVVPAFDMYAVYADAAGGRVVQIPSDADFVFPTSRVIEAVNDRTRLIWLTNPNNPSGQIIPQAAIVAIATAAPRALVVVDEAYADFSGETLIGTPHLDNLPNLVVGRTFAKAYGLAALRVGALVSAPATLAPLRRIVPPYSLNVCAAVALPAACADTAYHAWYLDQVRESKALLYDALSRRSIPHWKSAANFVLARFDGSAGAVVRGLAARGVLVRDRSNEPSCRDCVRFTTGVVEHTRTCIAALEEVLCDAV